MKEKDLDYIAKVEKAIAKKYGLEVIINPKSLWTDEKEDEYLKQIKERHKKTLKGFKEKVEKDGFFISKHLITRKSKRKCPVCDIYSFDLKDDLYMNKFECCFRCYIQYIEGREDRWEKGWRPNKE